jgi:hypothetical protein
MNDYDVRWGALRPILQEMADRITKIEEFLAASGLQMPTSSSLDFDPVQDAIPNSFTPAGSAIGQSAAQVHGINPGTNVSADAGVPEYIIVLAKTGRKIEAIKEYRTHTGAGLKEAKEAVDRLEIFGS